MPNSEDYLDGLLNSISKTKSDMTESDNRERHEQQERIRKRNRVAPDDDFLEMNGLSDYTPPRRKRRENLRRAISEDEYLEDFINEFEMDISEEEAEEFLSDFEKALDEVKHEEEAERHSAEAKGDPDVRTIKLPDGEEIPEFSEDEDPGKATDALLGNIDNVVSEARQKAVDEIESGGEEAAAPETPQEPKEAASQEAPGQDEGLSLDEIIAGVAAPEEPAKEEDPLQAEYGEDEFDKENLFEGGDTSAKEVPLMDESGNDIDLLTMLAAGEGGDLMDIGDLLNADEEGNVLEEAQESYEEGAAAAEEGQDPPGVEEAAAEAGEGEKKGFFAGIIDTIKSILPFGKKKEGEGEEAEAAEAEEDEEEAAEEKPAEEEEPPKKEKKKKEKKEKPKKEKPKKEKKPKPPKPPREKKQKPPDDSPKVPMKFIFICLILSASIIAFVMVYQKFIPQAKINKKAEEAFEAGQYFQTYTLLAGTNVDEDEIDLLDKAKLLAKMELRYRGFESGMKQRKYAYALDSLIIGYHIYSKNQKAADNFDITKEYDELGQKIVTQLRDQFGMTPEDSEELFNISSRKDYTRKLHQKIASLSLKSRGE